MAEEEEKKEDTEEEKKEDIESEEQEAAKVEDEKSQSLVDEANKAATRIEEANKEAEKHLARQENLKVRETLGGKAEAGTKKKELSPKEYADLVMAGEIGTRN